MKTPDTRQRLLDVSEYLFAKHGIEATSLRMITTEAGTNLASVHYHFGSKDGLLKTVVRRRLEPLNRERLRLLSACEAGAGGEASAVEAILDAFLRPVLLPAEGTAEVAPFACLMARLYADPEKSELLVAGLVEEVARRFSASLARALPRLSRPELLWRLHFIEGAMAHTFETSAILKEHHPDLCDPPRAKEMLGCLIAFVAGGLRAPASKYPKISPDDAKKG